MLAVSLMPLWTGVDEPVYDILYLEIEYPPEGDQQNDFE